MNDGLHISANGVLSNLVRQDVIANNLANVNTTGFKPDLVYFQNQQHNTPILNQINDGPSIHHTRIDLGQGTLTQTENVFDFAIEGDGFFVVDVGGAAGDRNLRLTRDGRFTLNDSGELIMASTGYHIMDANNRPIYLRHNTRVSVDSSGTVNQNGVLVAQLQLQTVANPSGLVKEGNNLLKADGASLQPATGNLRQGFVEGSAVDPILSLQAMINASKAVQANALMMQYHDHITDEAINTFGRVA